MENKPSTSMEVNEPAGSLPAKVNEAVWTKSLKNMPSITYGEIENYLILDKDKLPDHKPAEALKHKKGGYRLFKAGYTFNCVRSRIIKHVNKNLIKQLENTKKLQRRLQKNNKLY